MCSYCTSTPSLIVLGYLCGDCKDGKGVSALLNHCVDCSDANGILIAVLGKISRFIIFFYFMLPLTCTVVILDAVFISVLVYQDKKFTALLFPTIYFINVCSVTCDSGQSIMVCTLSTDDLLCWRKLSYLL